MPARTRPAALLDTSVVIASLDADEPHHAECDRVMAHGGHKLHAHALAETFSILTGGRHHRRLGPAAAADLIDGSVLPYVELVALDGSEVADALRECEARGVRGGAVYDLLHLAAARKAGVASLLTLNRRDFEALSRPGDPRIDRP
ncbi:MAG: PIN domain-containing protein [Burkholderiales bacterium]|nr:PIN domain-containing protein [Burkholderiales bacterium]